MVCSYPDFSIVSWAAASPPPFGVNGGGGGCGWGTATACGAGGAVAVAVAAGFGVFSGFGVSFSFRGVFAFPAFKPDPFVFDLVFAGLGDFSGVAEGVLSSPSFECLVLSDFGFAGFGDAAFFGCGVGDSSFDFDFFDSLFAVFDAPAFFGLGDGFGEGEISPRALIESWRLSFSSSETCARSNVPTSALRSSVMTIQARKRATAAQRNRAAARCNWRNSLSLCRLRHGRAQFRLGAFLFASHDRIQLAAEKKKETGQVHPGQKHNDRRERKICRIITVVSSDIDLE